MIYLACNNDLHNEIVDLCLDESTKVIRYLEVQNKKQEKYNTLMFIITLFGAISSAVAAITSILLFFQ